MISVRPPLSSVIERSASTFKRALDDDELRRPEFDEPEDPEELEGGIPALGGVRAPGNADGVGVDFGLGVLPLDDCGPLAYVEVDEPDASMPMA